MLEGGNPTCTPSIVPGIDTGSRMVVFDSDTVIAQARSQQWNNFRFDRGDGQKIFLERHMQGQRFEMHVWCTSGTVGTFLDHPHQGPTQLFRRNLDWSGLRRVLHNPRAHTGEGYHERSELRPGGEQQQLPKKQRVACPGCGKLCASMSGTAGHFESGSCRSCPGQDQALRVAYGQVCQLQHAAGHDGLFTGGMKLLTNETRLNSRGDVDYSAGYEAGGSNYACPNCKKRFGSSQALISHCENKATCSGYLHLVYGM